MKFRVPLLIAALICSSFLVVLGASNAALKTDEFVIKPYLQLGNHPELASLESEQVVWFTQHENRAWRLEVTQEAADWSSANVSITKHEISDTRIQPLYEYRCEISGLAPGKVFDYRVLLDGKTVFASWAKARKLASQPYRFDVFGDCGAGTLPQKLVAWQCYSEPKPDFVVIPGDIVYHDGLFSEYLSRFFPVYNNDVPDQMVGVPLMRSIPFVGVIGNHDAGLECGYPLDFNKFPDLLAYFILWHPPLNGPLKENEFSHDAPVLGGDPKTYEPFLKSAEHQFPRSAMFSFDYGNSHWLILDGNPYVNWRSPELRKWVDDDLAASHAVWKFVSFHQPGFTYDRVHGSEQRMRQLADVLQRNKVDIVFCGHAHDYQRTAPLTFTPELKDGLPFMQANGTVSGATEFDHKFDGNVHTVPHGVIHVVTGGGGAQLYGRESNLDPRKPPVEFISKFICDTHSLTRCQVNGNTLDFKQISAEGAELDHIVITKAPAVPSDKTERDGSGNE